MPTVGRIIAQIEKIPLKQVVQSAQGHMKPNGALTKAGKDAFIKAKAEMGLPKNASMKAVAEVSKKRAAEFAEKIKDAKNYVKKVIDTSALKDMTMPEIKVPEKLKKLVGEIPDKFKKFVKS